MQARANEDVTFPRPVLGCGVAPDGRINRQIRAGPAARFPALAAERMGAMSAERPRVVERPGGWAGARDARQLAQVEVTAVQVLQVDDFGRWCCCGDSARAGEIEIFAPCSAVARAFRRGQRLRQPKGDTGPTRTAMQRLKPAVDSPPCALRQRGGVRSVIQLNDARIVTAPKAHRYRHVVPGARILLLKQRAHALRAATAIRSVDEQNAASLSHAAATLREAARQTSRRPSRGQ